MEDLIFSEDQEDQLAQKILEIYGSLTVEEKLIACEILEEIALVSDFIKSD